MTVVILYAVEEDAYVISCDVDARGGRGMFILGPHADAMRFPDVRAALTYWKRQSTVQPLRADGQPNRPLTAFTVDVLKLED
jgi:hypothetical protein